MIAGHFGFAAAVKAREPATPLWALMLATVWLDIIFVPLFLAGIETIEKVPGAQSYGGSIIHADYTHSLVGALLLSLLLGAAAASAWSKRAVLVLGLVSFSHWLLDLIVHRADLPLLPRNAGHLPMQGFGLWRYPALSIAIELLLVLAGAYLYWQAARAVLQSAGRRATLANVPGAMLLGFGVLILALDASGIGS